MPHSTPRSASHSAPHSAGRESGFSLVELLVAMTITVTALGISLGALTSISSAREASSLLTDSHQSLRATINLMTRDLLVAGRNIPVGGISIPSGAGAIPLRRPSPTGTNVTFPAGNLTLQSITPGYWLGPAANGILTDMITILAVDTATLCGTTTLDDTPLAAIANDGTWATVQATTTISCANGGITAGDLVMFTNAKGSTLMMVTDVNGLTMTFAPGDAMNLNQQGAASGTILQLQDAGLLPPLFPFPYPDTTASRVLMTSYYLDASVVNRPRLMRRANLRPDRPIGIGIEDLQLMYDLVDGGVNPVNQRFMPPLHTPAQIRKATVFVAGRSRTAWTQTRQYLRTSLSAQVSLRSLSFVDRYNAVY